MRFLTTLCCLVLLAGQALAVEVEFFRSGQPTQPTSSISAGRCIYATLTSDNNVSDTTDFIFVGGLSINVLFEPNKDGGGAGAMITVQSCTAAVGQKPSDDTCSDFRFANTTVGDVLPDSADLDGVNINMRGASSLQVAGWIRFVVKTAPTGSDVSQLVVCAQGQGRGQG